MLPRTGRWIKAELDRLGIPYSDPGAVDRRLLRRAASSSSPSRSSASMAKRQFQSNLDNLKELMEANAL